MINNFSIDPTKYQNTKPFPHIYIDDFLNGDFAKEIQNEIMSLSDAEFDRYDNPFEQKYTLRDKYNYPSKLMILINELTSDVFVKKLSEIVGYDLVNDSDRNFWGVHKYKNGDKLDIHVDAGIHPVINLKKQVTLGIYLSYKWKDTYGCDLEIWTGDNAESDNAKIYECANKIAAIFNRLIIFTCDDCSWHGNPEPCISSDETARRIFITVSYLSHNENIKNKRKKALFVPRPNDVHDIEKDKLRLLRADPNSCNKIYRCNTESN